MRISWSKSLAPWLVAPLCAGVALLLAQAGASEPLDAGHAWIFLLSLSGLQGLALLAARREASACPSRIVRALVLGAAVALAVLLHKFLVSAFLMVPLRQDGLVLAYAGLAWLGLSLLDPHATVARGAASVREETRSGPLEVLLALLSMRFLWLSLILALLTLGARRTGLQSTYRDELLRLQAGYPETTQSSTRWELEPLAEGLDFQWPIDLLEDPDEADVLYVLERAGQLQRVDLTSQPPTKQLMLDIRSQVGEVSGELGALSAAFHPRSSSLDDSSFQYLYLYYTASSEAGMKNRLSRFDVHWGERRIDAASELVLIDQVDRDFWHNGGGLAFGLDGFLYLGMGDEGGAYADLLENSQRLDKNLFSGVLRIDVDQRGGEVSHPIRRAPEAGWTGHYFIPSDNPFVGEPNALEEFYAIGLRNPSRLSIDAATGELWVSDVGGSLYEELNLVPAGANLGWAKHEGPRRLGADPSPLLGDPTPPLFAYSHAGFRVCVIGGTRYRGGRHPELEGAYIYADYGSGEVFALWCEDGRPVRNEALTDPLANLALQISSLSDVDGQLLVTSIGRNQVYRLVRAEHGSSTRPLLTAQEAFQAYCTRCHGEGGNPDTAAAELAQRSARDLTDPAWQASVSDAHIARIIREGGALLRPDSPMPAWGEALTEAQIQALVQVIRGL